MARNRSGGKRAKSDAYFEGGYWLILWNFLLTAAICIFLLQSQISARLRDFAEKLTPSNTLRAAIYSVRVYSRSSLSSVFHSNSINRFIANTNTACRRKRSGHGLLSS